MDIREAMQIISKHDDLALDRLLTWHRVLKGAITMNSGSVADDDAYHEIDFEGLGVDPDEGTKLDAIEISVIEASLDLEVWIIRLAEQLKENAASRGKNAKLIASNLLKGYKL